MYITDPVGNIISNMSEKRSKAKVIEKLCALDLVSDRKELYKRRKRKSKNPWDAGEDDLPINDDWSSGESGKEGPKQGESSDGKRDFVYSFEFAQDYIWDAMWTITYRLMLNKFHVQYV